MAIQIAVVGAGVMGSNHARVLGSLPEFELVGVIDADMERANAIVARNENSQAFPSLAEALDAVTLDAVVVAVPTPFHHSVVQEAFEANLHVMVEKPIAVTMAEGQDMVAQAEKVGRVLMVGHVERFNPVAIELGKYINEPIHIETNRIGPFSDRVKDSVVLDLMIHDLDLVAHLAQSEVTDISAVGQSRKSSSWDLASVHLSFANGVTAHLTASRLGQQKIRTVNVTEQEVVLVADLIRQDLALHRLSHVEFVEEGGTRYRQAGMVEIPYLDTRGEPLALELQEFGRAIQENRTPAVDGNAGLRALEIVERIHEVLGRGAN